MCGKVPFDWLSSYIKEAKPILNIIKMAGQTLNLTSLIYPPVHSYLSLDYKKLFKIRNFLKSFQSKHSDNATKTQGVPGSKRE